MFMEGKKVSKQTLESVTKLPFLTTLHLQKIQIEPAEVNMSALQNVRQCQTATRLRLNICALKNKNLVHHLPTECSANCKVGCTQEYVFKKRTTEAINRTFERH
jgi:hypothetical protein